MTALEKQVEALMRLCTACDEASRKEAREEIRYLMQGRPARSVFRDPEYQLRQILLELGAPDHLLGHPYVIQAVLLVIQDRAYIDNITFRLYPRLAAQFDTTASRVERAIRHLVEVTWTRGDLDTLNHYFGAIVSPDKGKPTNGEFIARLANVVKPRIREGE